GWRAAGRRRCPSRADPGRRSSRSRSAAGCALKPSRPLRTLFTPAGVLPSAGPLRRAAKRLSALGFDVHIDQAALAKKQRFAGDDDTRVAALHRVALQAPSVALATRGGYGLTRLLDRLDWKL